MKGELRRSAAERKSSAARKPWDEAVIFKALMLQARSNLSSDQTEYRLRDRLSFMRPVALSRGAGGGGRGGKVVRPPRRLSLQGCCARGLNRLGVPRAAALRRPQCDKMGRATRAGRQPRSTHPAGAVPPYRRT